MEYGMRSNKITEVVRLQRMMKKWKKMATVTPKKATTAVPKGYVAVCVGEEMKRFVIPTEYLTHEAFESLLREAEEEFGFQQEGVLRIPCEVCVFESIVMRLMAL